MSWGGGNNKGAREVAAAFYAGKARKRGNCWTDGRTYFLYNHPIARRLHEDDVVKMVQARLMNEHYQRPGPEFTWAGWCTQTTARHLDALGVPNAHPGSSSQHDPRPPTICGKPVDDTAWYTLAEAVALPEYVPPPKRKRTVFVNITEPLFE